jgi:signal transduction histidine kinase
MARARHGFVLLLALLMHVARADCARAQSVRPPTRILILYSHDPKAPGVIGFTREFQSVVTSEWSDRVEVYEETLDFDRLEHRERWPQFAAYLTNKYRGQGLDAVVAEGSIGLKFVAKEFAPAFPEVPVVYGGAFEPIVDFAALPPNVTGRRIPLPFAPTFMLARKLQPGAKRVVIVAGSSMMDSVLIARAERDVTPLLGGMQLQVMRNWTYSSLMRSLRELPKESFVILSSFRKDWAGQSFNSGDLIPSVTRAASVPVYGIARNWVGDGIVGGTTMDFASEGARTGRLMVRVLRQPRGTPLPPREVAVNPTVVDSRQLQRWELSAERLPVGTHVLFRQLSTWERYRVAILLVLAITAVQSALIGLLALERRRRIRAQTSLQQQASYEQMLAALRTDAVRHAPDDSSRALEHAVARLGRYAAAESAELVVHDGSTRSRQEIIRWARGESDDPSPIASAETTTTELPLRSDDVLVGTLKLQGVPVQHIESTASRERLEAASEVLAGSLARARAARALAESQGHLAHIARVATVSQLGAAVSHELRQPLSAMRLHAEAGAMLLGQEPPDVREARVVFHDIVNDNARAIEVIEHIRMLLRRDTGASAPLSVNDICRGVATLLRLDAQSKQVTIDFALTDGLPAVFGDAVQLQQVVMNLALNAIEAASTSVAERRVVLRTAAHEGQVELEVSDSGPGLSPLAQQHLFESFFSTKKSGLGMGLTIVHQIVERHHGQVHAQNAPRGGAVFRVTLPAHAVMSGAENVSIGRTESVNVS